MIPALSFEAQMRQSFAGTGVRHTGIERTPQAGALAGHFDYYRCWSNIPGQ
jgi:hypothetical protein